MEFEVEFYERNGKESPIEVFLTSLKIKNHTLWIKTLAGLEKLKYRQYHKMPLTEYIEPELLSLRIKSGSNILRLLFGFKKNRKIILLHGFIKKSMKIPSKDLEIARQRLKGVV